MLGSSLALVCATALLVAQAVEPPASKSPPTDREEPHFHNSASDVAFRTTVDPLAADPSTAGEWALPMTWPASAVHSIVLHTGKILWYRGDEDVPTTYTWDPASNQLQSQTIGNIIWCGGMSVLPDGRVLATGGATVKGASTGPRWAYLFDPLTEQWTRTVDMRRGRYYPTHTLLGDGRTLVFSGTDEVGATNELVEAYVVGGAGVADRWDLLDSASRSMTYYPRMHLLPNGTVLHVGPGQNTDLLDPASETWQVLPDTLYGKRTHGTSVMLPPGFRRIMIVAGHDRGLPDPLATNTAEIIDMSQPSPRWTYANPMNYRRMHANTVIMPDGKVIVAGGTSDEDVTPVYPAEIYDPATGAWTVVASMRTKRGYHSSAVLLPDARVLWAGANGNPTGEVYSPPYLFRGPRPVISSTAASVPYGGNFAVQTADAASITSVVFIRPGASTHSINMEQRLVLLSYSQSGPTALSVTAPDDPNIAPPGYYMLFLLNGSGVPSVARFVLLGGAVTGNQRPNVDAGPNRTVILPQAASLDGTVSDDGQPVPPGTLLTTWTREAGPGAVTFGDASAVDTTARFSAAGTYLLRLTATDGQLTGSDTVSVVANEPGSGGFPVEIRVAAGSDDAEEKSSGSMYVTSTDLEMTLDTSVQKVGMRFNGVPVSRGDTVVRAWVQFRVDEATSDDTSLLIQGQAIDNAPTFTATTGDISARARTAASVPWSPVPWTTVGEEGPNERTPDLSPIIQEIVNRPGWARDDSIALIVTGSGKRVAKAYEALATGAALLHLELGSPPANRAPEVNAGADQTIRLPASTVLDATVTDDGLPLTPGFVTTLWVKESGPATGVVTFANPHAIDTTASFSEPGRYVVELEANDGELIGTGAVAIDVLENIPGLTFLDRRVASGAGDAEEKTSGGMSLTGNDLELVTDGSNVQKVGLRLAGISIPKGATIQAAYIQFQAKETQSEPTNLLIQGQAADNAADFTKTRLNVSSRLRTSASVPWSPSPWTTVGEAVGPQRTPDLSAIVQEIVNRTGWSSGNALVFIITGTGHRTADAFEGNAAGAARLHIEFN